MSKLIFQVGMLSFCVSTVLFGIRGEGLMQTIARSFLVFTGVVLALAITLVLASSVLRTKPAAGRDGQQQGGGDAAERSPREQPATKKS